MLLYHGTSLKNGEKILKSGIKPRQAEPGNWERCEVPSHPQCVYLTSVYAGYFAECAAGGDDGWAVFEIDTNQLNPDHLLPDEDYLAQIARRGFPEAEWPEMGGPENAGMVRYFSRYLLNYSPKLSRPEGESQITFAGKLASWRESIEDLGTCAYYGGVPRSAMTRAVIWRNTSESPLLAFNWLEPNICLENYRYGGSRHYGAMTQSLFAPPEEREVEGRMRELYEQASFEVLTLSPTRRSAKGRAAKGRTRIAPKAPKVICPTALPTCQAA
jgi:hypothetical protein